MKIANYREDTIRSITNRPENSDTYEEDLGYLRDQYYDLLRRVKENRLV
jgi:hypothetical protein